MPQRLVARELARTSRMLPLERIREIAQCFEVSVECAARRVLHNFEELRNTIVIVAERDGAKMHRWRGRGITSVRPVERSAEKEMLAAARKSHAKRDITTITKGRIRIEW